MGDKERVMDEIEEVIERTGIHIYFYYWTLPIFLILLIVNEYAPTYSIPFNYIDLMISTVSFLFGFLITISFSMLLSRVSLLKSALATETGRLVSLFELSKQLGSKFSERIKFHIDNYTVNTLRDYLNYDIGRDSTYGIYDDLNLMEIKTEGQKQAAASFLYVLGEFEPLREQLEYLTKRGLLWAVKFTNYTLAVLLVILLFLNRGNSFNNWLFVILSTTIFFILLIIEDYDNLKIGDYTVNISNSEQLFDLLGEKRYYPRRILARVKLEKGKSYRVGIYDSSIGKERVVTMRYKK